MITDHRSIDVHPIEVRGHWFTVKVDEDGMFRAYHDSAIEAAAAETRRELATQLGKLTGQVTVSVPVTQLTDGTVRHGKVTGIHAANRTYHVRWDDGEHAQLSMIRSNGEVLGGMTEDEGRQWARLDENVKAAGRALYAFRQAHAIDLHAEIRAAITAQTPAAH